jgi:hypothetical protein
MHPKEIHHDVEERKEVEEKEHTAQRKNGAELDPLQALIWPAGAGVGLVLRGGSDFFFFLVFSIIKSQKMVNLPL